MLILNIIWWFTDMIGISRIVPFIFLIISFPLAIIFPFLFAGGSAGMLIAQIGKIGKNRNVFFASLFATLPFVFLFIISIIGQFTEPLGFDNFPKDAEQIA